MRPLKSLFLGLQYSKVKVDVSLWPPSEKEGKQLPPSISLRLQQGKESSEQSTLSAYMKAADALKLANILENYAFEALEADSALRLENWKKNQKGSEEIAVSIK